ncbi:MAG TPA: hypothetical protein PKY63_08430 [Bacteroidales bacterium]|nr:hypothetical protein [Bacteroidales bacterium]
MNTEQGTPNFEVKSEIEKASLRIHKNSLLAAHHSLLTTHCSPLAAHHSLLTKGAQP